MLDYLHNKIDICREPFSDIGSRILVFKKQGTSELLIKLAERLTGIEPGLATYLLRSPFIENFYFCDEKGKKLAFEANTFPDRLSFKTKLGMFQLIFQNTETILIGLPENKTLGLQFVVNNSFRDLNATGAEVKNIKNFAYKTNAEINLNEMKPVPNGLKIFLLLKTGVDQCFAIKISSQEELSIDLNSFNQNASEARNRWKTVLESVPNVNSKYQEKYAFAWWVLLNNLVSPNGYLTQPTVMPSKAYYIGAWSWDNALHAIALRNLNKDLAQAQIKLILDHQLSDGMMPDAIYDEGVVTEIDHPFKARVTKPPIIAWAARKLYEKNPDKEFITAIYPHLVRENAWWFSQNDLDANGLVEYWHPYSSGLDDNPLWDGEMPVESPDINTHLYIQMENLAWMAEVLDKLEEASMWRARADTLLERMISSMWDEEKGLFWATHEQQPVEVVTPFNLFPLWTGKLSENMVERIVKNLTSTEMFWGKYAVTTVSKNDLKFDPNKMWRGPIWANINYFFIEALQRNNKFNLANELREKTLDLISNSPGMYEYYNPVTGSPPEMAAPVFSWTAAVFIELAIQVTNNTGKEL